MTVSVRSASGVVGADHGFERSALTNSGMGRAVDR